MLLIFIIIIILFIFVNGFISPAINIALQFVSYLTKSAFALFSNPDAVNPITLFTLCMILLIGLVFRNYLKLKAPLIIGVIATILVMYFSAHMVAPLFDGGEVKTASQMGIIN